MLIIQCQYIGLSSYNKAFVVDTLRAQSKLIPYYFVQYPENSIFMIFSLPCFILTHAVDRSQHLKPISQLPQCIRHISHNAAFCNRNVHTCTFLLQNAVLWDMRWVHCGICATSLYNLRMMTSLASLMEVRAPSRYKDHLSQVWGFPC